MQDLIGKKIQAVFEDEVDGDKVWVVFAEGCDFAYSVLQEEVCPVPAEARAKEIREQLEKNVAAYTAMFVKKEEKKDDGTPVGATSDAPNGPAPGSPLAELGSAPAPGTPAVGVDPGPASGGGENP